MTDTISKYGAEQGIEEVRVTPPRKRRHTHVHKPASRDRIQLLRYFGSPVVDTELAESRWD